VDLALTYHTSEAKTILKKTLKTSFRFPVATLARTAGNWKPETGNFGL
jgi:hypothetical protein